MSDDLLQRDLSLLSQRAAAAAAAPAVGTVIRRAVKRRRRRRFAAAAVVPIAAAAVIVSVSLAHSGGGQGVTVAAPSDGRAPNVVRAPAVIVPATMKIEDNGVLRRCILVDDPVTSKADASVRGALRSDPTGLSAVWKPSQVGKGGCVSTVTSVGAAQAAKTLAALGTTPAERSITPPQRAYSPGSVDLVFHYASGAPLSVVTVTLGSNGVVRLPDGRQFVSAAIEARIASLDPPAWARSDSGLSGTLP